MKQTLAKILVVIMAVISITALYSCEEKLTVTYSANGGAFADGTSEIKTEVQKDSLLKEPEAPTKENLVFKGWSLEEKGETLWKFDSDKVTKSITLYAVWEMSAEDKIFNENTPYQLYSATINEIKNAESYTMNTTTKGNIDGKTDEHIFTLKLNGQNQYCKESYTGTWNVTAQAWYADNILYISENENNTKQNVSPEDFNAEYSAKNMPLVKDRISFFENIPESWYGNSDFKKSDNGDRIVEFKINSETYIKACENLEFDTVNSELLNNVSFVVFKVYFNNMGKLTKIEYIYETQEFDFLRMIEFSDIGTTVVEAPEGSENWPEAS